MKEQYINYETAKLALEKGFKYELSTFYYDGRLGEDPIGLRLFPRILKMISN